MPFFNEAEGAEKVVRDLHRAFSAEEISFELVLVDNGSSDGTSQILSRLCLTCEGLTYLRVDRNQGYGWGILRGLAASRGRNVGFMAGDGQICPEDVMRTFRRFEVGDCDMAHVRRVTRGDGALRRVGSVCWNTLFSLLLQKRVKDGNGTPKVFRRVSLARLRLESRDWFLDSEIWMKGLALNWRFAEIEVSFLPRPSGSSHIRLSCLLEFARNLLRWLPRYYLRRPPLLPDDETERKGASHGSTD
jgi:glycosyltransferase involved in cell wall biosynthesis